MGKTIRKASLFLLGSLLIFWLELFASELVYFQLPIVGFWCFFGLLRVLSLLLADSLTLRNNEDRPFLAGAKLLLLCVFQIAFLWMFGKTQLTALLFNGLAEAASSEIDNLNGLLIVLHWIFLLGTAAVLLFVGFVLGFINFVDKIIAQTREHGTGDGSKPLKKSAKR